MLNQGKLTKKRLKTVVFNYAAGGGCELLEADLNAVVRRLDHDGDGEVSFSDFFNRLLPYFVYSGTGITPANQNQKYAPSGLKQKLKKNRSMMSLKQAVKKPQQSRQKSMDMVPQSIFDGRVAALSFEETKPLNHHRMSDRQLGVMHIRPNVCKLNKENKRPMTAAYIPPPHSKLVNRESYIQQYASIKSSGGQS